MSRTRLLVSFASVLFLSSVLVTQTGCVAVAAAGAAAGGVGYVRGDLEGYVNASVAKTVAACNSALVRAKYPKIKEHADAASATIIARTAADTRVTIRLKQVTETTTKISIRFGVFGDQQLSQVLMSDIRKGI